jgi:PhnB protein
VTSRLNPYLSFRTEAREAMEHYREVFGGTLTVSTFGELGMGEGPNADLVMHGMLVTPDGFTLMASDTPPEMGPRSDESYITISLSGDDPALRGYWDKLASGGTVTFPLEKQVWGDEFGQLTDRFGVSWMVNITSDQNAG